MTAASAPADAPILVVDDKPEKLFALRAALDELGEEIVEAGSGREALRHLLGREFAVILLDVNMPIMDGFETAELIRQRRLSAHTPIIFITAYGDDARVARGYSLGAVDYIVAPVEPEVLRSKVGVFVDLFRKTEQIRAQAEALGRRADQLQGLTLASIAINAALSIEAMLRVVAESARDLLRAREAIVESVVQDAGTAARAFAATAEGTIETTASDASGAPRVPGPVKLVADAERRTLSAPLTRRDGSSLGWIRVTDPAPGPLAPGDEALLVSLAQMAGIAIENSFSADVREANRLKDEFLTTLSHELRTPLSAVVGWVRLLRGSREDLGVLERGLDVIERNALSQARMVEDLLDISRITAGKLGIAPSRVELVPLVEGAVEAMRPTVSAKGLSLDVHVSPELRGSCVVSGDAERLQQVFRNLLSNAVKFTFRGGRIDVTLWPDGAGGYSVAVRDDGQGIAPAFLGSLFERFRQEDGSPSRAHGGLGVGLAIVRHLVEAHGGRVTADSPGVGAGATFTVHLPAAPPEHVPAAPGEETVGARPDLQGLRVLLVDDDPDGRDAIQELLGTYGAAVTSAASLVEALALLESSHDVLVSDIGMPGGDGYELLACLRRLPRERGGDIPAVALTAYARSEDRRRALEAGFRAHVPKPVDPLALMAAIHDAARGEGRPVRRANGSGGARRILVVEDDADNREAMRLLLETSGYAVDAAETGRMALEKARENGVDVALVDSRLPDMSGDDVARALRAAGAAKPLLIFGISGAAPHATGGSDPAFDAWLSKPLDLGRLNALLDGAWRG